MGFSFGELDVADEVGIGYFLVFGDGVLGYKEDGIGTFNKFGGVARFTSTLCQAKKIVCGGDFPSLFLGDGSKIVERRFGACNGIDHRVSSANNGA